MTLRWAYTPHLSGHMCDTHRYRPVIPEPAPSLSRHRAPIGGYHKITVICQVCMHCGLRVKTKMRKCHMAHKDCGRILFAFVSKCVVGKEPNTPNWSLMADDAITRCGIGVLGSQILYCGDTKSQWNPMLRMYWPAGLTFRGQRPHMIFDPILVEAICTE